MSALGLAILFLPCRADRAMLAVQAYDPIVEPVVLGITERSLRIQLAQERYHHAPDRLSWPWSREDHLVGAFYHTTADVIAVHAWQKHN